MVGILAASGMIGAWAGAEVAAYIPGSVLRKMFAVIMAIAAVKMFLKK